MASAGAAVKGFASETSKAAADAVRSTTSVSTALDQVGSKASGLGSSVGGLKTVLGALTGSAVAAGVAFGTKLSANLEQTQVAFTGIMGSASDAQAFIGRLQQFAAATPFTFTGLTEATQQLLAMGKTGDQAIDTLTVIGDAVAAMGGGEQQVQGVIRALTQMQSAGRLTAQDMNQISQQLPSVQRAEVFAVLAEKMGITQEAVVKLAETGQISADQGLSAIYEVMQKIPGAAGAMERQSKTLTGVLSSLKDQLTIAVGAGFQPLANAVRDSVYPILSQLGDLMKNTLTPLGAGLGDTFAGMATAFTTLSPNLVGVADAFGSLLSALGSLIPAAADLLNVVLVPLVPILQAISGVLEAALHIPGVVIAVQALTGAFLILKALQIAAVFGGIEAATITMGLAVGAVRAEIASMNAALATLPSAFGPVGVGVGLLTAALVLLKPTATDAEKAENLFADALKLTGDEATKATLAILAKKAADGDVADALKAAALNARDFADAVLSGGGALDDGGRASASFSNRLTALYEAGTITRAQFDLLNGSVGDLSFTYNSNAKDAANLIQAQKDLGTATSTTAKISDDLAKAIAKAFDPLEAYKAAVKAAGDAADEASKKTIDGIHKQFQAKKDTLADEERTEKDTLDRTTKARKDALDKQLSDEKDGLDAEHKQLLDALDLRFRAQKEALDNESRSRKDALDDQQRTEKEALDKRLRLLDEEADKRKTAENRLFAGQKDQIQLQIDSTFGAEREGWKQQLLDLEDAHTGRLDAIDNQNTDEKQSLKDGLDDKQRTEKEALDDQLTVLKDKLTDQEKAEKDSEDTRYQQAQNAFNDRATAQKNALDTEVTDLQNHLDDKYRRLKQNLDDREKAAATAEETRRTNAKADQTTTLADYQTFLDNQTTKAEQFNRDMATIASRGGADVLDVIGKLDPAIVAAAASAGPAAFTSFLESIRASIASGKDLTTTGLPGGVTFGTTVSRAVHHAEGHVAQIAMSGPRLWAEPETGGESYIPLALSKRDRSASILAQTASIMGYDLIRMANGGIISGSAAGGGTVVNYIANVDVQARVDAGIDLGVAGRVIADQVNRGINAGFDDLRRRIVVTTGRA